DVLARQRVPEIAPEIRNLAVRHVLSRQVATRGAPLPSGVLVVFDPYAPAVERRFVLAHVASMQHPRCSRLRERVTEDGTGLAKLQPRLPRQRHGGSRADTDDHEISVEPVPGARHDTRHAVLALE